MLRNFEKHWETLSNIETLKTLRRFLIYWISNIEFNSMSMWKIKTLKRYPMSNSMSIFSMWNSMFNVDLQTLTIQASNLSVLIIKKYFKSSSGRETLLSISWLSQSQSLQPDYTKSFNIKRNFQGPDNSSSPYLLVEVESLAIFESKDNCRKFMPPIFDYLQTETGCTKDQVIQ